MEAIELRRTFPTFGSMRTWVDELMLKTESVVDLDAYNMHSTKVDPFIWARLDEAAQVYHFGSKKRTYKMHYEIVQ